MLSMCVKINVILFSLAVLHIPPDIYSIGMDSENIILLKLFYEHF